MEAWSTRSTVGGAAQTWLIPGQVGTTWSRGKTPSKKIGGERLKLLKLWKMIGEWSNKRINYGDVTILNCRGFKPRKDWNLTGKWSHSTNVSQVMEIWRFERTNMGIKAWYFTNDSNENCKILRWSRGFNQRSQVVTFNVAIPIVTTQQKSWWPYFTIFMNLKSGMIELKCTRWAFFYLGCTQDLNTGIYWERTNRWFLWMYTGWSNL